MTVGLLNIFQCSKRSALELDHAFIIVNFLNKFSRQQIGFRPRFLEFKY